MTVLGLMENQGGSRCPCLPHRCPTACTAGAAPGLRLAALAADRWVLKRAPFLAMLPACQFTWRLGAQLDCAQHWLEAWYRRSARSSKCEAEGHLVAILHRMGLELRPTGRNTRALCWVLWLRLGLPHDTVSSVLRMMGADRF